MKVENAVYPNSEQIAALQAEGPEGPIYMVNLLKFKETADYDDGRETTLSGREAYMLYGEGVSALLGEVGGAAMFTAPVTGLTLGVVEDLWDLVAIAMYPSRKAMLEMMMSPAMAALSPHRSAGLEGQLNIEVAGAEGAWLVAEKGEPAK